MAWQIPQKHPELVMKQNKILLTKTNWDEGQRESWNGSVTF